MTDWIARVRSWWGSEEPIIRGLVVIVGLLLLVLLFTEGSR